MTDNIPDPAIYRGAADVIRANGWHQGSLANSRTNGFRIAAGETALSAERLPVCLIGAINVHTSGDPWDSNDRAWGACVWMRRLVNGAPGVWNDEPERTVDEVLDLLERAAVAAESARAEAAQDGGAR
ncbi:MAG: hypothetical protein HOQ45_18500 [Nocardioidaceae bacterium]|nr:hypothetical protein [Nocardioidaceae bacterium]